MSVRICEQTEDRVTEVFKKVMFMSLLVSLMAFAPLMADNQVITSPMASAVENAANADTFRGWQGYMSQLGASAPQDIEYEQLVQIRLAQARGSYDYPVTTGDSYTLRYIYNNQTVSVPVTVSHDNEISIPNVGTFDRAGKTFIELKSEIEAAVSSRYPYSNPVLSISSTGVFQVRVSGLVRSSSTYVDAWGLSRLSDLAEYASDSASTRDVTVISHDGNEAHYDLYKALKQGDESQNPLLRPGDTVIFNPRSVTVLLNGRVLRSGTYQLLEEDLSIWTLIEDYALGGMNDADFEHVSVSRYVDGHVENFTVASGEDFTLMDGDSVSVPSLTPQTGSVVITGALRSTDTTASYGTIQGQVSAQYFYRFAPGETLGEMLQTMSSYFTSSSDLDGAYITRDGKSWPVSLRDVMYGGSPDGDITLRNGDVLTVPFSNQIVTVNGAVNNPGTYAYVPGKDVSYYVNLAGGLTSSAKGLDRYKLFNSYGEKLDKDAVITAETTIEMEISTFERDLGITVSVVGLVATILGIVTSVIELSN